MSNPVIRKDDLSDSCKTVYDNINIIVCNMLGTEHPIKITDNELEYICSQSGFYREVAILQAVLGQLVYYNAPDYCREQIKKDINKLADIVEKERKQKKYDDYISFKDFKYEPFYTDLLNSNTSNVIEIDKVNKTATGTEQMKKQAENDLLKHIKSVKEQLKNSKKKKSFVDGDKTKQKIEKQQAELDKLQEEYEKKFGPEKVIKTKPLLLVMPEPVASAPVPETKTTVPLVLVTDVGKRKFRNDY
jgi:valyl-tRNA synthetase